MQRHAVLIGCNVGHDVEVRLKVAESDVDRVAAMLGRHAGWNILPLLRGNVTRAMIDEKIRELSRTWRPGDFVFVYYAGHAGTFHNQYSLLLPLEAYPVASLTDAFTNTTEPIGSMLILDCCSAEHAAQHALSHFVSGLQSDLERLLPAKRKAVQTIPNVRVLFAASAANQPARERGSGGLFTTAFLEAVEYGGQRYEAAPSGIVTMKSLKEYLTSNLTSTGQDVKSLVYGTEPDVKTTTRWRCLLKGDEKYLSAAPPIFEEWTHMWYASPGGEVPVVTSYWSGSTQSGNVTERDTSVCRVALGYRGQKVEVLDINRVQRNVHVVHSLPIAPARRGLKLSRNGQFLAVKDELDARINVFELTSSVPKRPREYATSANQFVLTARDELANELVTYEVKDGSAEVRVWPLTGNRAVAHGVLLGPRTSEHMRALPDGEGLITGGVVSGEARMWSMTALKSNARSLQPIDSYPIFPEAADRLGRPFGSVLRVAVSPTGDRIAVAFGGMLSHVRLWNRDDLSKPIAGIQYAEHDDPIQALEFSGDGMLVASGSMGGDVWITDLSTQRSDRVWYVKGDSIKALAFSQQGGRHALVIGTISGRVDVCRLGCEQAPHTLDDPRGRGEIMRLATLEDGKTPTQILIVTPRGCEIWDYVW